MFVEDGGLMSYGMDFSAVGRKVADIVDQILKGQKPGDVPARRPNLNWPSTSRRRKHSA